MKRIFEIALSAYIIASFKVERAIFRRTGVILPMLRKVWNQHGTRLQKALNEQHGTQIEYGYIC